MYVSPEYFIRVMHSAELAIYQKQFNAEFLKFPNQANMVRMTMGWQNIGNVSKFQVIRFQSPEERRQRARVIGVDQQPSICAWNIKCIGIPVLQPNHSA